jgi:hypothetical protein
MVTVRNFKIMFPMLWQKVNVYNWLAAKLKLKLGYCDL